MQLGDQCEEPMSSFAHFRVLQKLDLGAKPLFCAGPLSQNLLKCIGEMANLTWLSLSGIGEETHVLRISKLFIDLQTFQKLSHLDVSRNKFWYEPSVFERGRAYDTVVEAVCGLTSLRSISMRRNNLILGSNVPCRL